MEIDEDKATLLRSLNEIPGLKNLKADHVSGDSIAWKVRQVSFVALFDELARQGVAGLETNCAKLRELCEARTSALRSQKAKRASGQTGAAVTASPPSRLSLGRAALTTEAFRGAFSKVVADTLFAFGEDSFSSSDLMRDNAEGAESTRSALAFLVRECAARQAESASSPPPRVAFLHHHQRSSSNDYGAQSDRTDNRDTRQMTKNQRSEGNAHRKTPEGRNLKNQGAGSNQASSSTKLARGDDTLDGKAGGIIRMGGQLPPSLLPKGGEAKPISRLRARRQIKGRQSKIDSPLGVTLNYYGYENDDDEEEEEEEEEGAEGNSTIYTKDKVSARRPAESREHHQSRGQQQAGTRSNVRPAAQSQRLQQEVLRMQVLNLRRELALQWSSVDTQAQVTDATADVLQQLESSLHEVVHDLAGPPVDGSTPLTENVPVPAMEVGRREGKDQTKDEIEFPVPPVDYLGNIEGVDFEAGSRRNTCRTRSGGGKASAAPSGTQKVFMRLLEKVQGLRRQLRDARGEARRDEARRLRVDDAYSGSGSLGSIRYSGGGGYSSSGGGALGLGITGDARVLATPFLRRRLRRPSELPSRAFLDREWRRRAEEKRSTQPMVGTTEGILFGLPGGFGLQGPQKRARGNRRGRGGDRGANGTVVVEGDEALWPEDAPSEILQRTGWRGSFDDDDGDDDNHNGNDEEGGGGIGTGGVGDGGDKAKMTAQQQLVAIAGLEAVSPLSLTAIVALADALDAATFDLQDLAHELHTSGLTTAGKPWPSPSSPSVPSANLTDPSPTALALRYSTPTGKGTGAAGSSAETPVRMTPRTPTMLHEDGFDGGGGSLSGVFASPRTPPPPPLSEEDSRRQEATEPGRVVDDDVDDVERGKASEKVACRARRLSDTVAELAARVTALATLMPTTISGNDAPHGPGSRTTGGSTYRGGAAGRPATRDKIGDLAASIIVKGAASRQRLKALVRCADASFAAARAERSLLRAEVEQWRAREAAVSVAVEEFAVHLAKDWERCAGQVLERSLVDPLEVLLEAHRKAQGLGGGGGRRTQDDDDDADASGRGDEHNAGASQIYARMRNGAAGAEVASLFETLASYSGDLEFGLSEVRSAPAALRRSCQAHLKRARAALATRPLSPEASASSSSSPARPAQENTDEPSSWKSSLRSGD